MPYICFKTRSTTLYFENFTEEELRSFGYNKDHKFNQRPVLLTLMVTHKGSPVNYEVFQSIIKDVSNQNKYVIPSKTSQDALELYDVMHIKRNVVPFLLTTEM